MSVVTSNPATIEIRRGRFVCLIALVAAFAAVVTWAVSTSVSSRGGTVKPSHAAAALPNSSSTSSTSGNREAVVMSITPAALAAGALGGYALPSTLRGPTTAQILASMSPATRRYTKQIMSLSFAQLKAGAAGSP
jgi:hypothetical protein